MIAGHRSDWRNGLWSGHQLVIADEGGVAVRSEINLTSTDLDVPELAGLTEERLWIMRHANPPA
jgi:hypothetical protein